ncbi:hypothetical protein HFP57_05870 [Parasphingopyxis algicola]|uniref:hypothetical protein n=1 Tax=Parasphingopyxis algicola TaxID=2026624 RepID=UPI0015A25A58|nr:hypothetical protein [Parasphingopyxis algicola]QLC24601.1 hypothetical protein HFP57_05870 [Parasphingopyxis algicola]
MSDALPVEYHLELYTSSFYGDPFFSIKTSTPLSPISVGDQFEPRGFTDFPLKLAEGSILKVVDINHYIWEIETSHVGHKVMIVVEIAPRND